MKCRNNHRNFVCIALLQDEFRRCRSIDNPIQIIGFLSQWKFYLDNLQKTQQAASPGNSSIEIGQKLPEDLLEKVSYLE
jgi:hypothetical protein